MPSATPPELEPLHDVLAREGAEGAVRALYGAPTLAPRGVVHVASAWNGPRGRRTLRITDTSPKSAWDAFVLGLARARADAIVLTGAILRAEPALRYELDLHLATYRRALGKHEAPELWVLTTGRGGGPDHPALRGSSRPVVFTPKGVTLPARDPLEHRELPTGGLRELLARTRAESPNALVSIEAGPTTHRALYDDPVLVDELLLTLYEGSLASELVGGVMLGADALEAKLGAPHSERLAREAGGVFRFLRYCRGGAP